MYWIQRVSGMSSGHLLVTIHAASHRLRAAFIAGDLKLPLFLQEAMCSDSTSCVYGVQTGAHAKNGDTMAAIHASILLPLFVRAL